MYISSESLFNEVFYSKDGNLFFTEDLRHNKHMNKKSALYSNLLLSEFILTVCKQTADALVEGRYKEFDALVKNFGCQMTALEVHQLVNQKELHDEAAKVSDRVSKYFEKIGELYETLKDKKLKDVSNQEHQQFDLTLSPEMSHLVRFKILGIVNSNCLDHGREQPTTNLQPLINLVNHIYENRRLLIEGGYSDVLRSLKDKFPLKAWVGNLQAAESKSAAEFILNQAQSLSHERSPLLQQMLSHDYVRESKSTPKITSVPQLPSGEVAVRCFNGILLVKNKLMLGDNLRPDAEPKKVFIRMPKGKILTDEKVAQLDQKCPVMVLETLINSKVTTDKLKGILQKKRVVNFLNATLAHIPQYTQGTSQEQDEDMEKELEVFKTKSFHKIYKKAEVEHMFTSSIGEER